MGAGRDRHGKPVEGSVRMMGFLIGVVVGGTLGILVAALCRMGRDE